MTPPPGPSHEEVRAALARAADWAAGYLRDVGDLPVQSRVSPGDVAALVPEDPPAAGEPLDRILDDVERVVLPGITHWNHPGFFAYFGITGSGPGVVGELVASALNVNAMLWRTSPAATELEERATGWVARMLGLPPAWFGQITDSASTSTHAALAAAREAAGLDVRRRGMAGRDDLPPLRVYASEEAHSSVEKACIALGIGQEGYVKVPADDAYQMRPDALAAAVAADVAAGRRPIAAVASVGTTSTTSVDPVPAVADVCREHGMWLHVDAAYGGAAGAVPALRGVLDGCERADSLVVNPHKWLFVPIDCSLLYTGRPDVLRAAFSLVPAYLESGDGDAVNLMDYGLQLGRRFRALKLWMVLRAYGTDGVAALIARHVELARGLAERVDAAPGWERLAPVPLSTVCLRRRPPGVADEAALTRLNEAIVARVNAGGRVFLSHTVLRGRYAIRVAVGNAASGADDVDAAWRAVQEAAGEEEARAA